MAANLQALRGRIGGFTTHSRHDSREITAPARAEFLKRFELEVDPEGQLPEAERTRRAERARRAYFAKLALKSAEVRSRKAKGRTPAQGSAPTIVERPTNASGSG
jgi:hypothetical protein